ncbi:MAG: glycosyltransferase, partial [Duncaniella sp.]|nr:glycosyltransferase [Duncaniella sp.]
MISVIIPAYDAQEYLPEAIRSVLAQSFPDYELLVVDDGSTDRTASIAVATAGGDSRFRLLSKSNGGLADARNYGVANARGEWIAFLDSDDSLYPGALSLMYHVACKSGCDIVTAGFHRAYRYDVADGKYDSAFKVLSAVEAVGRTLYQRPGMYPSACAKLYRKSLFDRVGFTSGIW